MLGAVRKVTYYMFGFSRNDEDETMIDSVADETVVGYDEEERFDPVDNAERDTRDDAVEYDETLAVDEEEYPEDVIDDDEDADAAADERVVLGDDVYPEDDGTVDDEPVGVPADVAVVENDTVIEETVDDEPDYDGEPVDVSEPDPLGAVEPEPVVEERAEETVVATPAANGGVADLSTLIRFQRMTPDAVEPNRQHADDAGADLATVEEFVLHPGERRLVHTGIILEIPYGMLGYVVPRSGLAVKHGITIVNAPGLIDSGYRGEIMVCLLNTGDEPVEFKKGDRVAQLVIQRHVSPLFYETSALTVTARGAHGFGSTGVTTR